MKICKENLIRMLRAFAHIPVLIIITWSAVVNGLAAERSEIYPLAPVDTSSPRATLSSISYEVNEAFKAFKAGNHEKMMDHSYRAIRCLDLSEIPPALVERRRYEALYQLTEVLDRIELLDSEVIPDGSEVEAENIERWRLPHTEITIAKMLSGPHQGEFLFSAATIARIDEFYTRVQSLPKRRLGAIPEDVYQLFKAGYGGLLPVIVIQAIPNWAKISFLGQEIWKWIGLVLVFAFGVIACLIVFHFRPKQEKSIDAGAMLRRMLLPLTGIGAVLIMDYIAGRGLRITGVVTQILEIGGRLVIVVAAAYLLHIAISWLADYTVSRMSSRATSVDSQLVRLGFRLFYWITVIFAGTVIAEQFGLPVAAVAASLGVGGLAIALAAQPTLENLVAGLTIFGERSVSVGEYCRVGDTSGTVEEIGLRSTRLRTLERTLITIPNSDFAKLIQENYTRRDHILFQTMLGLRYETTAEQLRFVIGKLRELLYAHPKVMKDKLRVRFVGFGAYSLDLEIFAYIRTNDKPTFLAIREDLLLHIMKLVSETGAGFAFPSQTNYLASDPPIEKELVSASEEQVSKWRETGALPFPELAPETLKSIRDSLDYPPAGSAQAPQKS